MPRASMALVLAAGAALLPCLESAAAERLAGNVWTVEPEASTVTIVDAGRKIAFVYDAETIIRRGSTDWPIADLKRGDRIVVTLAEETPDALRARLIAIAGPPAAARFPLAMPSPGTP
ncbi:MAG: hypothetical protein FJ148_07495 [Deltaproteobacteria bacterium]|nr:hypothetical protein [Deltaproteobacteria bacterium]